MLRALKILDDAAPAHGWELSYVLSGRDPLVAAEGLPPARTHYLPALNRWRRWSARLTLPIDVARLARVARGADLFYACTLSSFPYCWFAGRTLGIPHVVHVYSSYGTPAPYRKHLLGRARSVVAPSADSLRLAREALGGFAPGVRGRVAYNGMDVERIRRAAAAAAPRALADDLVDGRPTIGMVGNLDARKNPATLVEAVPAIRAAVPDVRVLLVGAFPDRAYERTVRGRIAALGLEGAVRVTGFLPNPFPVVACLDVLVHPARRDPFPLALLEAMALARPIVASAVGGVPEMLVDGESGRLVPPDDAPALAAAVAALLRDPAAGARLGAAAHERLVTRFSLPRFAAEMFGVFDEAVADFRAAVGHA
jgi:glycosyltransferase involved in cell wall biosynthesis